MEFDSHPSDKDTVMEDDVVYLGEADDEAVAQGEEDSPGALSREAIVADMLAQRVPFKNDPFQPRPTLARVYARPTSWFGRIKKLHPVAFKVHIAMIETLGCISSVGGIHPYLWVDADTRLIGRTTAGKFVPADVNVLTDDDLDHLRIGVQGNGDLLDAEYEKVHQLMLAEMEGMR
jgi:hypothetical protein